MGIDGYRTFVYNRACPVIMKILRAYKTELDLNNHQKTACAQHAGAARYVYNWGLARKIMAREAGEKVPSEFDLSRELTVLKRGELNWLQDVSCMVPQRALHHLDDAYKHFFRRCKEKKSGRNVKVGVPRFKSWRTGLGSFTLRGNIHIFEKSIQLPRLGVLRLKERGYLPVDGFRILSATVSERGGRWFVSVQGEMDIPDPQPQGKPVAGVDLGIKCLAQVSDGTVIENPHAYRNALNKIKRLQRVVSRRKKNGANYHKGVIRLGRATTHAANIRKHAIHQATSLLTKTKSAVMLEDLNVSGMMKNHRLAQAVGDVGMYEFRRQMEYKGKWYGCEPLFADRFFPSTKRCSQCGHVKAEIGLGEREYRCEACGAVLDRDLNAAINLEQLIHLNSDPLRRNTPEVTPVESV